MKRVAHLMRPVAGGMRRHILLLLQALGDGFEHIVFIPSGDSLGSDLRGLGAEVREVPFPADGGVGASLALASSLSKAWRDETFDLVHAHGYRAGLAAGVTIRHLGGPFPLVVTIHNLPPAGPAGVAFPALRAFVRANTDRLIFVSEAVRASWGVDPPEGLVIYNGVDPRFLDAPAAGREGAGEARYAGGYFGRLAAEKGVDLFIRAIAASGLPDRFVICGDGPERRALEELAAELRVTPQLEFAAGDTDVNDLMRSTGVVVIPSRREGFSLVAVEALAVGKRVIAARTGGLEEALGRFGVFFPPEDVRSLARRLAQCSAAREEVGPDAHDFDAEAARDWAARFSIERMAQETRGVYDQLCGTPQSGGLPV